MNLKKKLFINGEWIESEEYYELRSPYTSEKIADIPLANTTEVNNAVETANAVQKTWKKSSKYERSVILEKLSDLYQKNIDEAAQIISLESSKPLKDAYKEIERTVQTFKFAAEEAKRIDGETISIDAAPGGEGRRGYTIFEPIGVIGAITPFNFPINLVAHKVGPAIAGGNTIVLKPANQTPLSSFYLAKLLKEAGLPDGVLNVVSGDGSSTGNAIVEHKNVDLITFTGSPTVGEVIKQNSGLKKVILELGSNSAVIIDKDVEISQKLIDRCITGAFSSNGQVCISLQRIYIHATKYEEFLERFVQSAGDLKLGNPMDIETDISALISQKELSSKLKLIKESVCEGIKIASGNEIVDGKILKPTIVLQPNQSSKILQEEFFAPVVSVITFDDISNAINLVNDSKYGLQAGIYTNDVRVANHAIENLEVGGVLINDIPTFRLDHMPYGGVKDSGTGREGIKYAIKEMSEMKLVIWNNN